MIAAIIPLYNGKDKIGNLLKILQKVKEVNKVIVVDNASTDDSVNFVKKHFPNVTLIQNKRNLGASGGYAVGIKYAYKKGYEWFWLLDQDSKPLPNALKELLNVYKKLEEICVYAGLQIDEKTKRVLYGIKEPTNEPTLVKCLNFSGMLIHRKIIENAGLPSKEFFMDCADWEYCLRVNHYGFKIVLVPKAIIYHSVGNPIQITLPLRRVEWKFKNGKFLKIYTKRTTIAGHSPLRYYTWAKNATKLINYKFITSDFKRYLHKCFLTEMIKIIFYEDEKIWKIFKFIKGVLDGFFENTKLRQNNCL
jgi:GT2 family glycosyltransferase